MCCALLCAARRRLVSFFSALTTNDTLTKLVLGRPALGRLGVADALACALRSNATLRELHLCEGAIVRIRAADGRDGDDEEEDYEDWYDPEKDEEARAAAAEGLALVLGALGGDAGGEAPPAAAAAEAGATASGEGGARSNRRRCAVSALALIDMPIIDAACAAALGASLRRGAPLTFCRVSTSTLSIGMHAVDGAAVAAEISGALVALGPSAVLRELCLDGCQIGDAGE